VHDSSSVGCRDGQAGRRGRLYRGWRADARAVPRRCAMARPS